MQTEQTKRTEQFYNNSAHQIWEAQQTEYYHVGLFIEPEDKLYQAQRQLVEEMTKPLGLSKESIVLDVGCGSGQVALDLAEKYACQINGITISRSQESVSQELLKNGTQRGVVKIEHMDAHQLSFASDNFTAAYAMESMLHMDRAKVSKQLSRVLQDRGLLVICDWYVIEPLTSKEEKILYENLAASYVDKEKYQSYLVKAGFNNIQFIDWTHQTKPTYEHWRHLSADMRGNLSAEVVKQFNFIESTITDIVLNKLGYILIIAENRK